MATYKVFVQDPGALTMSDASAVFDAEQSNLPRAARDRAVEGIAHFKFPVDEPDVPLIREGAELWAGWVSDSGDFLTVPRPYGGFIMQSEGYAIGPTHHIHCTLSNYMVLFGRCTVKGWPTGETASAIPTAGYPSGQSVTDWLVGDSGAGKPYDGVVRAFLPNCDYSGVAAAFDSLLWLNTNKPGTADPDFPFPGQWGFTTLDKILQDLVGGVRAVWPAVEPMYWLEAVANGAVVQPRFRWQDKNDTSGTLKGAFSVDPITGEFWIE